MPRRGCRTDIVLEAAGSQPFVQLRGDPRPLPPAFSPTTRLICRISTPGGGFAVWSPRMPDALLLGDGRHLPGYGAAERLPGPPKSGRERSGLRPCQEHVEPLKGFACV